MGKKVTSRKKTIKKTLRLKSKKGLVHHIDDFDNFEKIAGSILKKFEVDNRLQLAQSLKFQDAIKSISLNTSYLKTFDRLETYRICFNNLKPLSIAGNLACGGRFNIGGSQKSEHFQYDITACIYTASCIECAKAETGPHKNAEIYEISIRKELKLWDVKSLLMSADNSESLISAVERSPFNMQWSLQKFPTPSQILGAILKKIGGDGILYPSTKFNEGMVYGLFVNDEAAAEALLKANRIVDGQLELAAEAKNTDQK